MPERSPLALSCPAPKHCESWEVHETPRLSAKFSSYNPFKTARLNQAGGKTNYVIAVGLPQHSPRRITMRDQKVACSLKPPPEVANSGARSQPTRWPGGPVPGPVAVARSLWSRWPGPGGPLLGRVPASPREKRPILYALGTRTLLWFGHGCFRNRML